jgi:pseudouridine-5'-phosphate glycosidase
MKSSKSGTFHVNQLFQVALESTVITHGLPRPQNLELARSMESTVRENGAIPATIGIIDGQLRIGLSDDEIQRLSNETDLQKVSVRDLATVIFKKASGGTTVAATMFAAHRSGIRVFATGGIGGVHEVGSMDISTDLQALGSIPMIVVCAGAKAILDLPATLEYLETMAVPVIGYGTDEFPAFYSRKSGLPVSARLDSPSEVVAFAKTHWSLGLKSAVLVCQPLSPEKELPRETVEPIIEEARQKANELGIHGQALTPFLLARLAERSSGATLKANIALLLNNARLAAMIAVALGTQEKIKKA